MKYVEFDLNTGKIFAYYDDQINESIPNTSVEITDEQWQSAIDMNANHYDSVNGVFSVKDFRNESEILTETKTLKKFELKQARDAEVSNIIVTTSKQYVLNGDELSQTRMTRAIMGLPDDATTISWIGADGHSYNLTKPDLQEALYLAGEQQTNAFIKYATLKAQVDAATTVAEVEAIAW